MATTKINIRTDAKTKEAAEKLFEELGMNLSTAINVFLRQAVRSGSIPFEVSANTQDETSSD